MSTAIDGIVSGIDTTSLINAVIQAESGAKFAMEDERDLLTERRGKIATLAGHFTDVSTELGNIVDLEDWDLAGITSEDATAYKAKVDADAALGTYTIKVNSLAKAQTSATGGFADRAADNTIATGTLSVTVGGVTTPITIDDAADTLGDLAAKLNDVDGITAYTVNTGDASTPWRLVVQADQTGSAGAFTIDTSGLTGTSGGGVVPTFSTVSGATNAEVELNGITISSSTNVLDNVVPGIDLTLRTEGGPAEILTVEQDTSGLIDKIEAVFNKINETISYYDQQSFFNSETGNRGPLAGETTSRRAVERMGLIISNNYTVAGSDYEGLSQMGVKTNRDGTLTFDRTKFEEELTSNRDMVVAFLTATDGPFAALKTEIDDFQVDSAEGALVTKQESLKASIDSYEERIADFQDYLDSYAERMRTQFTNLEVTLGKLQSAQNSLAGLFAAMGTSNNG